jgi:hypothetical protein
MGEENQSWNELCEVSDQLLGQFASRPAAFREACRRRPDLAGAAIDPFGKPLMLRGLKRAAFGAAGIQNSPIVKAAARLGQAARSGSSTRV